MTKFLNRYSLGGLLLAFVFILNIASTNAADVKPERIGDWFVNCADEDKRGSCLMVQEVMMEKEGSRGRLISLTLVKNSQDGSIKGQFMLPLGIFLPEGFVFQIDEQDAAYQAPIQSCSNNGCMLIVNMDKALLEKLRSGTEVKAFYSVQKGQRLQTNMSLKGFTKAYNKAFN